MKALLYTLVLVAILVGSVIFLRSIPQHKPVGKPTYRQARTPMGVQSEPAPLSNIDPADLEDVNREALYETGVELFDLWHVPEAIDVLETLVARDPQHEDAYLKLVECYSNPTVGSESRARECWESARDIAYPARVDTTWISAFRNLFVDFMPLSAIADLTAVLRGDRDDIDVRLLLARASIVNGDTKAAERYLVEILETDPSLGQARELFVQCKLLHGQAAEAETLARDLVALYPQEPYPHVLLSRVLLARGNVAEAAEIGENGLLLDARYVPAIVSRAHAYVAEGEPEAARVTFEKLLMFDNPMVASVAMEGIAYIDFLHGRFDEASESMDEAIRLAVGHGSPRRGMVYAFRLMEYLCELGRTDAAEAVLDRWVKRHSEIPAGLGALRIRVSRGGSREVRRILGQAERNEEWRSWMRLLSLDYADFEALALIEEKNFKQALKVLETPGRDPGGARRAYLTGYTRFQDGDAEAAAVFFEQTRSGLYSAVFPYHSDPILFVQSVFFMAEAAFARGDRESAARYYRDFLSFWGESDWELQAVERARSQLDALSTTPER